MTSICVFTDVHAHEPALVSIIDDAQALGISRLWCLGDFASGGPHPAACFDLVMERCELVLAGNHEVFVYSNAWRGNSSGWALAARKARGELGPDRVDRLAELPHGLKQGEIWTVHGSLSDPAHDFVEGAADAAINFVSLRARLLLFGHTHRAAHWTRPEARKMPTLAQPGLNERIALNEQALISPGAGCDVAGARWLALELDGNGVPTVATWRQTAVSGHLQPGSFE